MAEPVSLSVAPVDGGSITLVFLHFLGGSGREWEAVVASLPNGCVTRTIDLPGFGDNAARDGYTVAAMAEHVIAELTGLAPSRIVLVGHSMGAKVVAAVARRGEDGDAAVPPLAGLVMVAGSPPGPEPMEADKRATMRGWFAGTPERSRTEAAGYIDQNVSRPLAPGEREKAIDDVLRMHRPAWDAWLAAGSREDWAARIGLLRTPTLVIAGEEDDALGPDAQRRHMVPHFLNVHLAAVPDTGHLLPLECPGDVARLVGEHLLRVAPPVPDGFDPPFAALIASPRVSDGTRAALMTRLTSTSGPSTLDATAFAILLALVRRVVPQETVDAVWLADTVAGDFVGTGNGWRFDRLPPDREAGPMGLRMLDVAAVGRHGIRFAAIATPDQDRLLADIAAGRLAVPVEDGGFDADQMRLWFEEVRSAIVRAYMSHPGTLARIGYSGFANGGDGPHKTGFAAIGEGDVEPWEPATPARHPVP